MNVVFRKMPPKKPLDLTKAEIRRILNQQKKLPKIVHWVPKTKKKKKH